MQEITPHAVGVHRFNSDDKRVDSFPDETEIRAVIEGQFIAKQVHAEKLGYRLGRSTILEIALCDTLLPNKFMPRN